MDCGHSMHHKRSEMIKMDMVCLPLSTPLAVKCKRRSDMTDSIKTLDAVYRVNSAAIVRVQTCRADAECFACSMFTKREEKTMSRCSKR